MENRKVIVQEEYTNEPEYKKAVEAAEGNLDACVERVVTLFPDVSFAVDASGTLSFSVFEEDKVNAILDGINQSLERIRGLGKLLNELAAASKEVNGKEYQHGDEMRNPRLLLFQENIDQPDSKWMLD